MWSHVNGLNSQLTLFCATLKNLETSRITLPKLSYRLMYGLSHDGSCPLASRFLNLQEKPRHYGCKHDDAGARWQSRHLTCDHTEKWLRSHACGEWLCRWPGSQLGTPAVCTTAAQTGTAHNHMGYNQRTEGTSIGLKALFPHLRLRSFIGIHLVQELHF